MNILVITTGGTIGAMPYDDPCNPPEYIALPANNRDIVRETLETWDKTDICYINAGLRESNLIDEPYRLNLVRHIEAATVNKILITHGTGTLLQTAEFLFQAAQRSSSLADKVILFTGAMMPLLNGPESDGYLNLDFSIAFLARPDVEAGVYIVLCDYEVSETQTGWKPRLYFYQSGAYEKLYNPGDGRYHRIRTING